jgi:hypothetical protein
VKRRWAGAAVGFLLLSACTVGSGAPISFTQVRVPSLQSAASFDAIEIDQTRHRLFAADRTDSGVDVFDLTSTPATYTHTISLNSSPNGLAYAPDLKRLFVGLEDGSLAIVDDHETVTKQVATGGKSVDLIDYAPSTNEVFASNPTDSTIARIDAATGAVKGTIKIAGFGLEQPRYNPTDRTLYVTSPDAGVMFAVDPGTGAIKSRINLGGCNARGMAINPKLDQALIACRGWVQRINLRDRNDLGSYNEVAGGDVVNYDAVADRFLVAMPDAIPSGVAVLGGNPISYIATARSRSKGNSAALDEATQTVYTPDVRAGTAGLVAFALPTGEPAISIDPWAVGELGVILGVIALVVVVIGRGGDPANRPEPIPPRRRRSLSRN